jgi:hypothetical protein
MIANERKSRRVKKMEKNRTNPGIHRWFIQNTRPGIDINSTHITPGEVFSIFFMQHWGEVGDTLFASEIPDKSPP